jgi:hypothetical protein
MILQPIIVQLIVKATGLSEYDVPNMPKRGDYVSNITARYINLLVRFVLLRGVVVLPNVMDFVVDIIIVLLQVVVVVVVVVVNEQ